MRAGFSEAAEEMMQRFEQVNALVDETGDDLETVMKALAAADDTFMSSTNDLMKDMLFGGTSNLSRHTEMTQPLIADLGFLPGENGSEERRVGQEWVSTWRSRWTQDNQK